MGGNKQTIQTKIAPNDLRGSGNAILSFIQTEKLTLSALVERYGGIKQAVLVAIFKAIQRMGFDILIYYDDQRIEGGLGIRKETEHKVVMFNFIDMRGAESVCDAFALRDKFIDLFDSFDVDEWVKIILKNKEELQKFSDSQPITDEMIKSFENGEDIKDSSIVQLVTEEMKNWKKQLHMLRMPVIRIVSTYRAHGLDMDSYDKASPEHFTLQEILDIVTREGLVDDEEESVNEGFNITTEEDLPEPERIPDAKRSTSYSLPSGVVLTMEDLAVAADIYRGIQQFDAIRAALSSKTYADRIFNYVPNSEITNILEKVRFLEIVNEVPEDEALPTAIEEWLGELTDKIMERFYEQYKDNFAGDILSKEELLAGTDDEKTDVFHSKNMAIKYLLPEDYWLWKIISRPRSEADTGTTEPDATINIPD